MNFTQTEKLPSTMRYATILTHFHCDRSQKDKRREEMDIILVDD